MNENDDLVEHLRPEDESEEALAPGARAKREVAHRLRRLSETIARSRATPDELEALAGRLADELAGLQAADEGRAPVAPTERVIFPGMEDFRDRSPITGHANPLAPPARLAADPDAGLVLGEVTFGPSFEGAPGIVHGGFVSALLDEALGMACTFSGGPAMTAELVTRYLRHTPVNRPLRVEAHLVSVEGRKVHAKGAVYDGDEPLVEATGLFIAVDTAKFASLAAARDEREG